MNFEPLLQQKHCDCGKTHQCDIRHILIEKGATRKIGTLLDGYHHILVVADTNTYAVTGKAVEEQVGSRQENRLIYHREGVLVPNEQAIEEMEALLTPQTDLILGIGSGVIQDLCKYVSFFHKLPYYIVATAPSMDGYASVGAAMILKNMKVTVSTHVPQAIIGDADILKDAPMDMIRSGYGDIIGKYSCLNDWKLSHVINGEYFCQYVHDVMFDMVLKTRPLGPKLQARDPEAIQTLMEALVGGGVAMAMVGNSRPASGSEHHLSHFFEITGIVHDEPYFMHGTDVAYSSIYTQGLRETLLRYEEMPENTPMSRESWEKHIREIYGSAAQGVIDLQKKMGWYEIDRRPIYREKWQAIREVLAQAPSTQEMLGYLQSIGLDIEDFEKLYGKEKINNALVFAKDLKDRFSVLWVYYDLVVTE